MDRIKRYADYDSRIVSIKYIIDYSIKDGFDLPPSQREKEWVNEQNSKFILSIFENKPLGSFIFNKRNGKLFILDGQHRINALELFIRDNFGVKINNEHIFYEGKSINAKKINKKIKNLSDEQKREFIDTEIFIREYNNLTDDDMANIIDSINEGIKNDNINIKKDINNTEKIDDLLNKTSEYIYNKEYIKLKDHLKCDVKKYVAYIGTIIENFDDYENDLEYTQLNLHHVKRFFNKLLINNDIDNIDDVIINILNFIKILFSDELLKDDDISKVIDKYELNNYYINCICYKIYEKHNQNNFNDNLKKYRKIIKNLIENYNKSQFRELIDAFNNLYDKYIN
jgi:hypothetical protein